MTCEACGDSCLKCVTDKDTCTECKSAQRKVLDGKCVCIEGYLENIDTKQCEADKEAILLEIKTKYWAKKTQTISIQFTEQINEFKAASLLQVYFKKEGGTTKIVPKSITIEKESILNIVLDLSESVDSQPIYINLQEVEKEAPTAVTAKSDPKRYFKEWPISLDISYYSTGAVAAAGATAQSASYISVGMTAILMIVSFNAALILIKLF